MASITDSGTGMNVKTKMPIVHHAASNFGTLSGALWATLLEAVASACG